MIHINFNALPLAARVLAGGPPRRAVCEIELEPGDSLTQIAFESDCDGCRVRLNISSSRDKDAHGKLFGVAEAPVYEAKPRDDAETLLAEKQVRDKAEKDA